MPANASVTVKGAGTISADFTTSIVDGVAHYPGDPTNVDGRPKIQWWSAITYDLTSPTTGCHALIFTLPERTVNKDWEDCTITVPASGIVEGDIVVAQSMLVGGKGQLGPTTVHSDFVVTVQTH
jgi:hypothetical protein